MKHNQFVSRQHVSISIAFLLPKKSCNAAVTVLSGNLFVKNSPFYSSIQLYSCFLPAPKASFSVSFGTFVIASSGHGDA